MYLLSSCSSKDKGHWESVFDSQFWWLKSCLDSARDPRTSRLFFGLGKHSPVLPESSFTGRSGRGPWLSVLQSLTENYTRSCPSPLIELDDLNQATQRPLSSLHKVNVHSLTGSFLSQNISQSTYYTLVSHCQRKIWSPRTTLEENICSRLSSGFRVLVCLCTLKWEKGSFVVRLPIILQTQIRVRT